MSKTTFTIEGRGLKLNSAAQVQEFINTIEGMDQLENVILSGNTFGVEACRALAASLAKKPLLKVKRSETNDTLRALSIHWNLTISLLFCPPTTFL